ncbi:MULTISPECIES: adenosylmethionine decarboxylase [unclassified Roseateles]|uniref:adenosylmethionine decarboxylase n=1 Tax=unclassified Roseateles TaxID=2626991 RepID=UPI0006FC96BD|nr:MULTISPECIES: adenosylmethionine decarboxylase [unclassified Roseateles]KQW44634.1 S-adenosylmethionine decarboxylase proenzyme [Pelomonas sp. Root405]KRA69993.1 S-adenosylmethionine decarboxylase proenzyme [Pelomonas sp. Root662]
MQGLHLTADLNGVDPRLPVMRDADALAALCRTAVVQSGLSGVAELFHRFSPDDEQSGVTGVVLLAESHLAIHTWPELGGVTVDVYVCNYGADNSAKAEALMAALVKAFEPIAISRQSLSRAAASAPAV